MCACTPTIRTPNCESGRPGCRPEDLWGSAYPRPSGARDAPRVDPITVDLVDKDQGE